MSHTPSAERVAHTFIAGKYGIEMMVGDKVEISTRRGKVEATIVDVKHNYRARKYPYEVRFTTDGGEDYHGKRGSIRYDAPENRGTKYIGRSRGKKKLEQSRQRDQDRDQQKQDRTVEGVEALYKWKLNPGDVIRYRYTNMDRNEVVSKVNFRTGKVGIERFTPLQKEDYLEALQQKKEDRALWDALGLTQGFRRRKVMDRSLRWLPATGIIKVVKRGRE